MAALVQIQPGTTPIRHAIIDVLNYVVLLVFKVFLLGLITSLANADEILKCTSRTGQIIYSNVLCKNQVPSSKGGEVSPNDAGRIESPQGEVGQGTIRQGPRVPITATEGGVGVFFVDGYIGDKPVRFIVDTGASEVSIPYRKALELGIPIFVGQRGEAATASSQVGIYRLRLNSITIGNITVRNVDAEVTLNIGGSENVLLGMSFLRNVTLIIRHGVLAIDP